MIRNLADVDYLEHLPGALVIDMEGIVVYMNDQCAEYLNVNKEESIGRHILKVFPETKMLEAMNLDKPKIVYYSSECGIGISINLPVFEKGKKVGIMEYDVVQGSEVLYELADEYTQFLDEELNYLRENIHELRKTKYGIENIIGNSEAIVALKKQITNAANTSSTVVIYGETGTGKELVAHAIHQLSSRRLNNFVKLNSASLPENLAESELFGYEKGAFTGADNKGKKGKFLIANKGTLFIDEINQMGYGLQPKLLRVLQEKEIEPIGGEKSIPVDTRIIVASNEDLKTLVDEGKFREDLYYRLNVVEIRTPPLKEHLEDIPILLESFVAEINKDMGKNISIIDERIAPLLKKHKWPGNVRELHNVIERAMNKAKGNRLSLEDFNFGFLSEEYLQAATEGVFNVEGESPIEEAKRNIEKTVILNAIEECNGNKTKAAKLLKITRPLLYQKMNRLKIKL